MFPETPIKDGAARHRLPGMVLLLAGLVLLAGFLAGCGLSEGQEASGAAASLEAETLGVPGKKHNPTIKQYLAYEGPTAHEIANGKLKLNGRPVACGKRPTVMDPNLDSWGGAFPGYVILNPARMRGLSTPVKFYIYYHECGHQFVGPSETGADCYSVRRGVRAGWLDQAGMDQVCAFISTLRGDKVHPPGPERCKLMRQCFAEAQAAKRRAKEASAP